MFDKTIEHTIKNFLDNCGIKFESFDDLDGMIIPREILLMNKAELFIKRRPKLLFGKC